MQATFSSFHLSPFLPRARRRRSNLRRSLSFLAGLKKWTAAQLSTSCRGYHDRQEAMAFHRQQLAARQQAKSGFGL